jgi:GNAT superfamily N-acetyltransferase
VEIIVRRASEADLPAIMELLALLAEFDGCRDAFVATEDQLRQAFFSSTPRAQVLIAVVDGQAIGLATYYPTFSTWQAKPGIWLDDLYVREGYRNRGVGKALMAELARTARGLGCGRIEWIVALSNDRGIAFYERRGATVDHTSRRVLLGAAEIERLAEGAGQPGTNDAGIGMQA